jgi:hypothetical protein
MNDAGAIDALTAKVNELAHICAGLSKENAELRNQLSALSAQIVPSQDQAIGSGVYGTPSGNSDPGWPAEGAGAAQFSRRAMVGVALAGAAAGIAGMTAVTERGARPAATDATTHAVAMGNTGAAVELTAAEQAAAPTATGSVIAATLSTASPVVAGTNTSTGAGVSGTNTSTGAGVSGTNTSTGAGVSGTSKGTGPAVSAANSSTGPGVHATSSRGRGGIFAGSAAAQIQLTPGAASHPRSGQRGDLYADGSGRLWFCKTTGATATWHQIA